MGKKMNILMFSGEYDKALAALILANSAKEIDMDVTMFFAFWGLLLIRDPNNNMGYEDEFSYPMFNKRLMLSLMNKGYLLKGEPIC